MRICWSNYLLWLVVAALGVMALVSGCGQKGDLYRVPPPQQEQVDKDNDERDR